MPNAFATYFTEISLNFESYLVFLEIFSLNCYKYSAVADQNLSNLRQIMLYSFVFISFADKMVPCLYLGAITFLTFT